ncbi:MAG: VOC family protein [Verrucomicrobia bacterium]|nr:VOC family protein [Verrucomicrobiota bacterium]
MNTKNTRTSICLWYDGQAAEAAEFYTSLIPNSRITGMTPMMVEFQLDGVPFQALNGGPHFKFNEAASISISTRDQDETDRLWEALTGNGGSEGQCAWLKDRYGLSWQIVPEVLSRLLGSDDRPAADRVLNAMMKMKKINIATLEAAFRGGEIAGA